jgi:hypothetical protein
MNQTNKHVEQGAKWLDKRCPGWADRVDLDVLHLDSDSACILGQLTGSFGRWMLGRCNFLLGMLWAVRHGFQVSFRRHMASPRAAEQELREAWVKTIKARRAAKPALSEAAKESPIGIYDLGQGRPRSMSRREDAGAVLYRV